MKPSQEIIGETFGFLTVKESVKKQSKSDLRFRTHYKCFCSCGNERIVSKDKLLKGNLKSCGCKKHLCGPLNKTWKGYGEIPRKYFSNLRHHAIKLRNIPFEISIEEMWDLFLNQNRKCALSGVDLNFSSSNSSGDGNASLDRIDSSKGYAAGNIQWVHKDLNWMKHQLSQSQFLNWIERVYKHNFNQ